MTIIINTPDAVPDQLILASWGDTVRADLFRIRDNKLERDGSIVMTGMLTLPSTNPSQPNHATRKAWVEAVFVQVDGGNSMTANLNMGNHKVVAVATPTATTDAANKTYVDTTTVSRSGDSMSGALNMGNNDLTGLPDPPGGASHATRKSWVDDEITALRADLMSEINALNTRCNNLQAQIDDLD